MAPSNKKKRREMYFKDEHFIKKNFGKAEHFHVPKDYFDTLTPRILNEIRTEAQDNASTTFKSGMTYNIAGQHNTARTTSMWHRYRAAVVSAVASVLIGGFALSAWMQGGGHTQSGDKQISTSTVGSSSNLDAMMNYSMMDTEDMYSYIADSE